MKLKYLFQATYKDGSVYMQNEEDRSVTEPETRSCYYDINEEEIKSFFVFDEKNTFSVNLEDGHFEVNGVPFFMHTNPELTGFRLIYYREHTHSFNQENGVELSHEVTYCFGWKANDANGNPVKPVIMKIQ